ncbi:hypothetical protein [Actinoplanes sp. NPDC051851]|uniref:hypothetical protein n=1 Tax=Actinoplanes sp. NPDC051851 TaxID=3154753 RepID=UPI003439BF9C
MTAAVFAVVAIAGFLGHFIAADRKQAKRITTSSKVISLLPDIAAFKDLAMFCGGDSLDAPTLHEVEFSNVGRESVKPVDIERPCSVRFADGVIVQAVVGFREAPGSPVEMLEGKAIPGKAGRDVQAPKILLNPGNSLIFYVVVSGSSGQPVPSLHADGCHLMKESDGFRVDAGGIPILVVAVLSTCVALVAAVSAVLSLL